MTSLPYRLIRSSRRTLALQIQRSGDIVVRAPMRYSIEKIESFLREKSSWIMKHQKKIEENTLAKQKEEGYYYLFGERYEKGEKNAEAIQKLSKNTLKTYIDTRLPELASGKVFRRDIANIRINSARTRWGSCSSKGTLSFSSRLASFPRETIDAVIIHEFAHLIHANHSKKFWNLVYEWMPDYEAHTALLKKISPGGEIE